MANKCYATDLKDWYTGVSVWIQQSQWKEQLWRLKECYINVCIWLIEQNLVRRIVQVKQIKVN